MVCFHTGCKVTPAGKEYSGDIAMTSSQLPCKRWDAEPGNENSDPDLFPDASLEDASNFCRNPDDKPGGPWCYIDKAADQWDYCDIPMCDGTMKIIKYHFKLGPDKIFDRDNTPTYSGLTSFNVYRSLMMVFCLDLYFVLHCRSDQLFEKCPFSLEKCR